jgi:SAM-dependent methyltransferase
VFGQSPPYYSDKLSSLSDIFGTDDVELTPSSLRVGELHYPIVDDVIVLLDPDQYPPELKGRLARKTRGTLVTDFAADIQATFAAEWRSFSEILPEHEKEFKDYFDVVSLDTLGGRRVCDLGCGSGRWSYFLVGWCRELVLVDFSDAIFVARRNLAGNRSALFFMGDLLRLPFRQDFADFVLCLGVLHHLPVPALDVVRRMRTYSPSLLVYLYYKLDNRPPHFRVLLRLVTWTRSLTSRIRDERLRSAIIWAGAVALYWPLVAIGGALNRVGIGRVVPLYDSYRGKSLKRIRQDVYDRFFTRIEQRVSRAQIEQLSDTFPVVRVSAGIPYWHFLCERAGKFGQGP